MAADARNADLAVTFRIRDAGPDDMAVLQDVFRRSSLSNESDRAKLLAHPQVLELSDAAATEGRVRVAVDGDVILGFATWLPTAGAIELEDLFVDPGWMRRGVGRTLVQDIAAIAANHGAGRVEVTAGQNARAFYAKVGFVADHPVQTTFGPAIRMHLDLT